MSTPIHDALAAKHLIDRIDWDAVTAEIAAEGWEE